MEEHKYILFKGRWGISIDIFGQVFDKKLFREDCIEVCNGLWLSFSDSPLIENEIFCEDDKEAIFYAINMVQQLIVSNTPFHDGTVIQICSLQYNVCYYQKEAMIVAMISWCSKVFGFKYKEITSNFDKENNRYNFEF